MEIGEGYLPLGGEAAACWYCGVAVAGRVQVSPPAAALSPGGGGFDPGGGGFDPGEAATWEHIAFVWKRCVRLM